MNREQYLARSATREFVDWLAQRLDSPGSFRHSYVTRRERTAWECDCLYSAFAGYRWPFQMRDPLTGRIIWGSTFDETLMALEPVGTELKEALRAGDHSRVLRCCQAVRTWGGLVTGSYLERLGRDLVPRLRQWVRQLGDPGLRLDDLPAVEINSGWTKIYSLLVPGFTMYDSRVAAALALLVATFAQQQGLSDIPPELRFALLPDRSTVRRRPSAFADRFPAAGPDDGHHLRSNVMANWLLGRVITAHQSRFDELPRGRDLWALQSALFMIGYETAPGGAGGSDWKATPAAGRDTGNWRRSNRKADAPPPAGSCFEVTPLSGRGTPITVTRRGEGFHLAWGNVSFWLDRQLIQAILEEFLVDRAAWYPLGASRTNPPPGGLGSFVARRVSGLTPPHASAIAPVLVHEGLVEWRGTGPIELRRVVAQAQVGDSDGAPHATAERWTRS